MSTLCMTSSRAAPEVLPLSTLKTVRTPRRPKNELMEWSWMDAGSEWISQLPNEPILPLQESTWDAPHMVAAAAAAVVVVVVAAAAHPVVSQGTMTGATTEATIEVTIVTMIVTMTASTVRTDADLHLLTIVEDTALDHGPTRHVTTEQQKRRQKYYHLFFLLVCF